MFGELQINFATSLTVSLPVFVVIITVDSRGPPVTTYGHFRLLGVTVLAENSMCIGVLNL